MTWILKPKTTTWFIDIFNKQFLFYGKGKSITQTAMLWNVKITSRFPYMKYRLFC